MQLPVIKGQRLIQSASFAWIDNVYRTKVPTEAQNNTATTDVLVKETDNDLTEYANNKFQSWFYGVEVQIFYKKGLPSDFDMILSEIRLIKLFENNGWKKQRSDPHINDPDTEQVTVAIFFTKKETIKKEDI